jgi:Protein of unknown function (DUF1275)
MQTGNVIFLGLGIADASGAPVVAPLVALGAFLVGGSAAALLTRPSTHTSGDGLQMAMTAEIGLLGVAAILAGAVAGALLLKASLALAIAAAAAVVVVAAVSNRGPARRTAQPAGPNI